MTDWHRLDQLLKNHDIIDYDFHLGKHLSRHLTSVWTIDHGTICMDHGMQGVHYTERARAEAGRIQAWPGLTISTALHRLEQLQQEHGSLDYAFLSPIFDSISKAGYSAAFDHKELSAAVAQAPMPVYALGGKASPAAPMTGGLHKVVNPVMPICPCCSPHLRVRHTMK